VAISLLSCNEIVELEVGADQMRDEDDNNLFEKGKELYYLYQFNIINFLGKLQFNVFFIKKVQLY